MQNPTLHMKCIIASLLLICAIGCKQKPRPFDSGLQGQTLPAFDILLPDSTTYFSTTEISRNNSFAVFYFSPYCPYCRAELHDIISNNNALKGIPFYLVTNFPFGDMKRFYTEFKLQEYPNIITGFDFNSSIANYYRPKGIPYLALYGKNKKLKVVYVGKIDFNDLHMALTDNKIAQ
jgi:thiol-disulfide isomerase/thioredoxin